MRAGAAQEKPANWRFVARPIEDRAHGEKLIERQFAVENVATREAVTCFEIVRSDDLHVFDEAGKIGCVLRQCLDYGLAKITATRVPIIFGLDDGFAISRSAGEFERGELHVGRKNMLAFRREGVIE